MDIHLIWGEAAMLDLPRIAQMAREAEAAARRLGTQDMAEARIACAAAIRAMREGLDDEEARWTAQHESGHALEGPRYRGPAGAPQGNRIHHRVRRWRG